MALSNKFDLIDDFAPFDVEQLSSGELAVEIASYRERETKSGGIVELGCKLVWSANEQDQQHIGKQFTHSFFFFGQNATTTVKILKDILRAAKFNVNAWIKESDVPLSVMLPASLKLLAWKRAVVAGKVARPQNDQGQTRAFFNFTKILRQQPETGNEYDDALPSPVPDDLVLEAVGVTGLDGNDFNHGANEIPV